MIPNLDNTASEIVQYQRDSTVQRKDLAQKTKDFRKLDDAAKLVEVKGLLKGERKPSCSMARSLLYHSIPNFHRPPYESFKIYELGFFTSLRVTVRSARPIPVA
jgi:hypothetical protein